jgi:hypothetical protein
VLNHDGCEEREGKKIHYRLCCKRRLPETKDALFHHGGSADRWFSEHGLRLDE